MKTVTVTLEVPPAFSAACASFDVDEGCLLQFYISFFNYAVSLIVHQDDLFISTHTQLFQAFIQSRPKRVIENEQKREVCSRYRNNIITLMIGPDEWSEMGYRKLMKEWCIELNTINKKNSLICKRLLQ